jgi:hypothetical protein
MYAMDPLFVRPSQVDTIIPYIYIYVQNKRIILSYIPLRNSLSLRYMHVQLLHKKKVISTCVRALMNEDIGGYSLELSA